MLLKEFNHLSSTCIPYEARFPRHARLVLRPFDEAWKWNVYPPIVIREEKGVDSSLDEVGIYIANLTKAQVMGG